MGLTDYEIIYCFVDEALFYLTHDVKNEIKVKEKDLSLSGLFLMSFMST